jgi:para-aminobenzoate synthetase component 1
MTQVYPIPAEKNATWFRQLFARLANEPILAAFSSQGFSDPRVESPFMPPLVDWLLAWEPIEVRSPSLAQGIAGFAPMPGNQFWVGHFCYEAGFARWQHKLPSLNGKAGYFFRPAHVLYALHGQLYHVGPTLPWLETWIRSGGAGEVSVAFKPHSPIRAQWKFNKPEYLKKAASLLRLMDLGEIYEVNFCNKLQLNLPLDTNWPAFLLDWTARQPMPFSAFLRTPQETVVSVSPERFACFRDGQWFSQPMKGTAPRAEDPQEDQAAAFRLQENAKERSENIMIVDLGWKTARLREWLKWTNDES